MYIVVCVKMVPDTTQVRIDPETNTLIREGVPFITNPFDTHAVEEALRLKDKYGAHVTAVSMGPPSAESVLRQAIAMGVYDGVLLSDRVFGGADTLATSKVLAEAVKKLNDQRKVDLVICGRQTIDGDTAQVGPGIACRLGFSQLTLVDKIMEADQQKKTIRAQRKLEQYHEVVEANLPALITVVRSINTPRYPTVPRRLDAADAQIPLWSNDVLKLDINKIGLRGSPTQVKKIFAPQREKGELISGENGNMQTAIDSFLNKLTEWDFIRMNN